MNFESLSRDGGNDFFKMNFKKSKNLKIIAIQSTNACLPVHTPINTLLQNLEEVPGVDYLSTLQC